ncbi:MAG TPA: hypothetical protein PLQ68_07840, partial [Clostridia bacterium]|nr:hypothetical protein [Clostridia bacterium]
QTNQGNWLTATGFSTHSADDVWSVATRALTDKAGFTISGTKTTLDALNDLASGDISTACGTALTSYDPPTFAEMTEAFTEIKGVTWSSETDTLEHIRNKQTDIETDTQDLQTQIGTDGVGLTNLPWNSSWDAEVQSEVQDAIEANHLDHLFAADYNPASKPGVATALLNELIESDSGVSRFTANSLEQAPSGGGGATAQQVWEYATRTITNTPDVNVTQIQGHTLAGTGTQIADGLEHFFDVATPAKTMNDCGVAGSGLSAEDVWTYATRVLTGNTNLNDPSAGDIADAVWDEAIADHNTGTTFGGKNQRIVPSETLNDYKADISTLATASALATVNSIVDAILADTNELQTNQGNWLTATGFSTFDPETDILENTYSYADIFRIWQSGLAGKSTGGGTTEMSFLAIDGETARITATMDENGNRTEITLNGE